MEKPIYKSRTMWVGIFAIVYAIYQAAMTGTVDPQQVMQFLTGAGFMTLRAAGN